jgi:hypothetical protein
VNRTKLNGHSVAGLRLAIRQERQSLIQERIKLLPKVQRLVEIDDKLAELEKAEYLLENES